MTFATWMMLGLCTIHMQDDELTMRTCQATFESQHRVVPFEDDMDKFDREYFDYEMRRKV